MAELQSTMGAKASVGTRLCYVNFRRPTPACLRAVKSVARGSKISVALPCTEHVRQLEGESPFDNLMEVKS